MSGVSSSSIRAISSFRISFSFFETLHRQGRIRPLRLKRGNRLIQIAVFALKNFQFQAQHLFMAQFMGGVQCPGLPLFFLSLASEPL